MDREKNYGDITAQRLKDLREQAGLSHAALAAEFNAKYEELKYVDGSGQEKEIRLSESALKNFEVGDKPHTKRLAGDGMGIRYLRCLADFYGVSADYLLGTTDIKSPNANLRAICEYTGLSEAAVKSLRHLNESSALETWRGFVYNPISFIDKLLDRPLGPHSWLSTMITSFCVACQHRYPKKDLSDHINTLESFDYSSLPKGFTVVERRDYSDYALYETERYFSKIIRGMAGIAEKQRIESEGTHAINKTTDN